jgi:hypothetical protein
LPDFPDQLFNILFKYSDHRGLQHQDALWFIEFLDDVLACIVLYLFTTEPT